MKGIHPRRDEEGEDPVQIEDEGNCTVQGSNTCLYFTYRSLAIINGIPFFWPTQHCGFSNTYHADCADKYLGRSNMGLDHVRNEAGGHADDGY